VLDGTSLNGDGTALEYFYHVPKYVGYRKYRKCRKYMYSDLLQAFYGFYLK